MRRLSKIIRSMFVKMAHLNAFTYRFVKMKHSIYHWYRSFMSDCHYDIVLHDYNAIEEIQNLTAKLHSMMTLRQFAA